MTARLFWLPTCLVRMPAWPEYLFGLNTSLTGLNACLARKTACFAFMHACLPGPNSCLHGLNAFLASIPECLTRMSACYMAWMPYCCLRAFLPGLNAWLPT